MSETRRGCRGSLSSPHSSTLFVSASPVSEEILRHRQEVPAGLLQFYHEDKQDKQEKPLRGGESLTTIYRGTH